MIEKLNKAIDCRVIWSTINNAADRAKNFIGLKIAKTNKRLNFQQGTRNALLFDCSKYWKFAYL
jgi:hypothetical protein